MVNGEGEGTEGLSGSVCLTSVSVCGLVEHEHGIVDLRGDKQHRFRRGAQTCHAAYCLTSALLKFCREARQQMDRGEEGGG